MVVKCLEKIQPTAEIIGVVWPALQKTQKKHLPARFAAKRILIHLSLQSDAIVAAEKWTCTVCTLENETGTSACEVCESPYQPPPSATSAPAPGAAPVPAVVAAETKTVASGSLFCFAFSPCRFAPR